MCLIVSLFFPSFLVFQFFFFIEFWLLFILIFFSLYIMRITLASNSVYSITVSGWRHCCPQLYSHVCWVRWVRNLPSSVLSSTKLNLIWYTNPFSPFKFIVIVIIVYSQTTSMNIVINVMHVLYYKLKKKRRC